MADIAHVEIIPEVDDGDMSRLVEAMDRAREVADELCGILDEIERMKVRVTVSARHSRGRTV